MIGRLMHRLRHPQTTVRWRLTLLYGGLFLICGGALLGVTYALVSHASVQSQVTVPGPFAIEQAVRPPPNASFPPYAKVTLQKARSEIRRLAKTNTGRAAILSLAAQQRVSDLHQLEIESAIALAIMTLISGALGWVVAGRVLSPLRTITTATRQISEANLHERLAMPGPRDELRTLAATIDGLLERLEGAFDAQRRFVANASHELRTPLTAGQALLEMVMSDPDATLDTFRQTCAQVLEESAQQEELIDSLLALARGQRGIDRREPVALADLAADIIRRRELDAQANGLTLQVSLQPATAAGDRRLLDRLVANLLDNAIRHNIHGGTVSLRVATAADGRATLSIANTGAIVPADEVERLLAPFQRMAADRTGPRDGLGLGLSIVAAIASAHGATLDVRPRAGGGLEIALQFPPAPHAQAPAPASVAPPAAVPA
ncbi:MAG TPA: HAMP domain-containing sensor histidine kinase [Solirubrobacteraceae bacterium]|nr:HAMP domain-containing sensor histidine kinase [Solirubrobacteraceae bacterium]